MTYHYFPTQRDAEQAVRRFKAQGLAAYLVGSTRGQWEVRAW